MMNLDEDRLLDLGDEAKECDNKTLVTRYAAYAQVGDKEAIAVYKAEILARMK